MNELSERRLAENEISFRHTNYKRVGSARLSDKDKMVEFYCECSRMDCKERIPLDASTYMQLHKNNRQFIALPGHENKQIEEVIEPREGYNVIQKYVDPSDALHVARQF